jgi:hypothetical protein
MPDTLSVLFEVHAPWRGKSSCESTETVNRAEAGGGAARSAARTRPPQEPTRHGRGACRLTGSGRSVGRKNEKDKPQGGGERGPRPRRSPGLTFGSTGAAPHARLALDLHGPQLSKHGTRASGRASWTRIMARRTVSKILWEGSGRASDRHPKGRNGPRPRPFARRWLGETGAAPICAKGEGASLVRGAGRSCRPEPRVSVVRQASETACLGENSRSCVAHRMTL